MLNELISVLFVLVFVILCAFFIDYRKSIRLWYILLLFLFIGFTDNLFHTITIHFPDLQLIRSHTWGNQYLNWSGKLYSIVFGLLMVLFIRKIIARDEIGLRLKQNKNSVRFSLIFILIIFLVSALGLLEPGNGLDLNALLYGAIMPGLNEELIYRGLLLGILNKIFDRKFRLFKTNFGWGAILVSVAFGLLHGFQLSESFQVNFDVVSVLLTGIYGFIFALIRERSGSLVFPIIAHSTADFFSFLFSMI
jgi:membrane protease YdiL (CAAX protease family)